MMPSTFERLGNSLWMAHAAVCVLLAVGWFSTLLIKSLLRRHRACDIALGIGLCGFCLVVIPHPTLMKQATWEALFAKLFKVSEPQQLNAPFSSVLSEVENPDGLPKVLDTVADNAGLASIPTDSARPAELEETSSVSMYLSTLNWNVQATVAYLVVGFILTIWLLLGGRRLYQIRRRAVFVGTDASGYSMIESDEIAQPCCFGLLRPVICLPHARDSKVDWTCVIRHEAAHLQRKDPWSRTLANIAIPLFYIQPFYWLLRRQAILTSEYVADQLAASHSDRAAYAEGLIACLRNTSSGNGSIASSTRLLADSARTMLVARIGKLLEKATSTGKPATWKWLAMYVIPAMVLMLGVVLCTDAREIEATSPINGIRGKWVERDNHASAFASTDASIPGIAFHLQDVETKTVTGRVTDMQNAPVAGAEICCSSFYGRMPLRERSTTDDQGRFTVKLPWGPAFGNTTWSITAVKKNLYGEATQLKENGYELKLKPGRTVKLRAVEDVGRNPIRRFLVHIADGRILSSDVSGECVVEGLAPRVQYLCVTATNRESQIWMMDLSADRIVEHEVVMPPGGLVEGKVMDDQGVPVAWNSVSIFIEQSILTVRTAFSDEKGRYQLSGLRVGRPEKLRAFSHMVGSLMSNWDEETITIGAAGRTTQDFTVTPNRIEHPEENVIYSLSSGSEPDYGYFRGRVMLPDGTPCKNFRLRLFVSQTETEGGFAGSFGSLGIVYSTIDGSFQFSELESDHTVGVTVSAQGYRDAVVDPVSAVAKEKLADSPVHQLTLQPIAGVRLIVRDQAGLPVPNAKARLFRGEPQRNIHDYIKDRWLFEGTANSSGVIVLDNVSLAFGRLIVEANGFGEPQFPWNGTTESVLTMRKSVVVSFHFQFEGDIQKNLVVTLWRKQDRRHVAESKDLSRESPIWYIPELVPDVYRLSASGFQFKAEENAKYEQEIDLTMNESQTQEFSFTMTPVDPTNR